MGALLSPDVPRSFQGQVFVGRMALLFVVAEAMLFAYFDDRARPAERRSQAAWADAARRGARRADAAASPISRKASRQPFLAIFVSAILAALAQAPLWGIVYVITGLTLDLISGRPPTFAPPTTIGAPASSKARSTAASFMFLLLVVAFPLREPAVVAFVKDHALLLSPLLGLAYPLIQTIVGSADGTPPFFGRLRQNYRDPRSLCARHRRGNRRASGR